MSDGSEIALVITFPARVFTDEHASDLMEDKVSHGTCNYCEKKKKWYNDNNDLKSGKEITLLISRVQSLSFKFNDDEPAASPAPTSCFKTRITSPPSDLTLCSISPCDSIWPQPRCASPFRTPRGRRPACCACGRSSLCKTRRKIRWLSQTCAERRHSWGRGRQTRGRPTWK